MKIGAGKIIACLGMVMMVVHWSEAQWVKQIMPYSTGIIISSLMVDGNYIYASSNIGIFRSTDSGASWVIANSSLANEGITSLIVAGGQIIAGTSSGIYLSIDNGSNWSEATLNLSDVYVSSFAISGNIVFAGTEINVYRSPDSGKSWIVDTFGSNNFEDVQAISASGSNILAGTLDKGLFRSTNSGVNWVIDSFGIGSQINVPALLLNGGIALADIISEGYGYGKVYRSNDTGKTWVVANAGMPSGININAFAVYGNMFFAGLDSSVYRSLDSGKTWSFVNSGGGGNTFAVSGNRIMVGGIGGFRYSTDGGTSWTSSNTGLNDYIVNAFKVCGNAILTNATENDYQITVLNGNDVGTKPSEGVFRSTDNGNSWMEVNAGGGTALAISGNTAFAVGGGLYSSINSGVTWAAVDTAGLAKTFTVLLADKAYLFAGGSSGIVGDSEDVTMFRSTDGGNSWINITSGLPRAQFCEGLDDPACQWYYYYITALTAIGNMLFAATSLSAPPTGIIGAGQIYSSLDTGLTWHLSSAGLADTVQCIATNGSILFAGTANSGVFLSHDTGTTWTASSFGLTNTNIQALFATGADLFAGTHGGGIFHSADSGKSWTPFNNGLTDSSIQSFGVNDTYLFAGAGPGTYGGSVWRYPLSQVSVKRAQQLRPELASLKVHSMGRFNPAVSIDFSIPSPEKVSIGIYDLSGHLVTTIDDKLFTAGQHTLQWNARNAGSGCYVVRMQAGGSVQVRAVPVVRQ